MRLLDYLGLLRQRIGLVIVVIGVVAALALGLSLVQDPQYEAGVRIRVVPAAPADKNLAGLIPDNVNATDIGTEAELVKSKQVLDQVARDFGLAEAPPSLVDQLTVLPLGDTAVMLLKVVASDPDDAIRLANSVADTYLEVRRDEAARALDAKRTEAELEGQEAQTRLERADAAMQAAPEGSIAWADAKAERDIALEDLGLARLKIRALNDQAAVQEGFGQIIEPANRAKTIREASPGRSVVFGLLLGTPLALAAVLLLDSLSDTVRTKADAESLTGVDVVGLIPADDRIRDREGYPAVDVDPFSAVSEAYRTSSLNLSRIADEQGARTILVTSPLDGEGKTTTTVNMAIAQSERGVPTLLVEGDLRRPRTHELLGVSRLPGMSDVLRGKLAPRKGVHKVRPHLELAPAGTPAERPDQLLSSADLPKVLAGLAGVPARRSRARTKAATATGDATVLIDGAPMLQATETSSVASAVDGVVLVLRAGVTHSKAAARAAEQVRRAGGTLLGVLLVGVASPAEMGFGGSDGTYGARIFSLVGRRRHKDGFTFDDAGWDEGYDEAADLGDDVAGDGYEYEYVYEDADTAAGTAADAADGEDGEWEWTYEYDEAADGAEYDEEYTGDDAPRSSAG